MSFALVDAKGEFLMSFPGGLLSQLQQFDDPAIQAFINAGEADEDGVEEMLSELEGNKDWSDLYEALAMAEGGVMLSDEVEYADEEYALDYHTPGGHGHDQKKHGRPGDGEEEESVKSKEKEADPYKELMDSLPKHVNNAIDLENQMMKEGGDGFDYGPKARSLKQRITENIANRIRNDPAVVAFIASDAFKPFINEAKDRMDVDFHYRDKVQLLTAYLIKEWAETSADHSAASLALQKAAADEFNLSLGHLKGRIGEYMKRSASFKGLSSKKPAFWDNEIDGKWTPEFDDRMYFRPEMQNVFRAYHRAVYANTQEFLREKGITEVSLWRGYEGYKSGVPKHAVSINVFRDGMAGKDVIKGATGSVALQPLSSFSTSLDTAEGFGNYVTRTVVPARDVYSTALTGIGCAHETEVVVLGRAKYRTNFYAVEKGTKFGRRDVSRIFAGHVEGEFNVKKLGKWSGTKHDPGYIVTGHVMESVLIKAAQTTRDLYIEKQPIRMKASPFDSDVRIRFSNTKPAGWSVRWWDRGKKRGPTKSKAVKSKPIINTIVLHGPSKQKILHQVKVTGPFFTAIEKAESAKKGVLTTAEFNALKKIWYSMNNFKTGLLGGY